MRLKNYLHQISPVLSTPHAARRLLRIFALVLLVGMLGGVYSFLLFTFTCWPAAASCPAITGWTCMATTPW
jgi:preprotein translocase subunit SecF